MSRRSKLHRSDSPATHVYFLTEGVASVVAYTQDGQSGEVALIGRASAPGAVSLLGSGLTGAECEMLTDGSAWRLTLSNAHSLFERRLDFRAAILSYIQDRLLLQQQIAVCTSHHLCEQRIARWLLAFSSLASTDCAKLTQEQLSKLMSTRRTTVSSTLAGMQRDGLLMQRRGELLLMDKSRLEKRACSCYSAWQEIFRRRWQMADATTTVPFRELSDPAFVSIPPTAPSPSVGVTSASSLAKAAIPNA